MKAQNLQDLVRNIFDQTYLTNGILRLIYK